MSALVEDSRAVNVVYFNCSKALDSLPKHPRGWAAEIDTEEVGWKPAEAPARLGSAALGPAGGPGGTPGVSSEAV